MGWCIVKFTIGKQGKLFGYGHPTQISESKSIIILLFSQMSNLLQEYFMDCHLLDPKTILVATSIKGIGGIDTPVIQTWRFSSDLEGTLCGTYAMPFINIDPLQFPRSQARIEILGDRSPPCREKNSSSLFPCYFYPSNRQRMVKLLWLPILRQDHREIFVPVSVFHQNFDFEPWNPIPYFVWSSQQVQVPQNIPIKRVLPVDRSVCSGRQVIYPSSTQIQIFDFITPRCGDSRTKPTNPAIGALVLSPRQNGLEIEVDDPRSYSLPYWNMRREIKTIPWAGSEENAMIDDEHIVLMEVSGGALAYLG